MNEDRRTKAQLLEQLAKVEQEVSALRGRIVPAPARVPEAEALAGCIRALDQLKGAGSSYGVSAEVRRTIIALCEKYGIERVEKITEPCTRRHVEDLSAMDVFTAVRRDLEGFSA